MPAGATIDIRALSKSFGSVSAVRNLGFTVEPGQVTGFLGPNGAGKTTTLRTPLGTVGTALEVASFHPGRSARNHRIYARAAGLRQSRVDEVLAQVPIAKVVALAVVGAGYGVAALVGSSVFTAIGTGRATAATLEWWQGGLVLSGIAALAGATGYFTSRRKDVT
ncbi:MAG: ATP-binding cassette domain-containing protein [Lacisediminihabitans sp.]